MLEGMNTQVYIYLIFLSLTDIGVFPVLPFKTRGINPCLVRFFYFLWDRVQIEKKERWECQQGSTWQLRVINHCHDGERWRMKDMRAGAQQTWQESLSRDLMNQPIQQPLLCCWYETVTSHPARVLRRSESAKWEHLGQKGGKGKASDSDQHMDCALNYCQASSSQRLGIFLEDSRVMDHENIQSSGKPGFLSNPALTCITFPARPKCNNTISFQT